MAFIIGIDPGKNNVGIVCVEDTLEVTPMIVRDNEQYPSVCEPTAPRVLKAHLCRRPDKMHIDNAISVHLSEINSFVGWVSTQYKMRDWNTKVVIEAPTVYPGSNKRVSDIVDLMRIAGNIEGSLRRYHAPIYMVKPAEWKGQVPKKVHNRRVLESAPDLVPHLQKYPKSHHEHIIDAYGIAAWYATKVKR